jgi:uncharacterized repeat protein (TIGR01451 family)
MIGNSSNGTRHENGLPGHFFMISSAAKLFPALGWLLTGLATALPLSARADIEMMAITNVWRYEQSNNLDGVSWQAAAFDDSAWAAGQALLYVETSSLVSPRNTPLTLGRTTYYFRSPLLLTYHPSNVFALTFSARIDDGAVFYLNGQEVQRIRMPAAPTVITYTNLATTTTSSGDARTDDVFVLTGASLSSLTLGTNLLAVEVHQQATNSDDVVFGTAVKLAVSNTPPILLAQPTNISVLDGRLATLSAVIDGNPTPNLQWFKNGNSIPGATNVSLSFANTYPADAGTYWLTASNSFGSLVTSNATVTVLPDTNSPTIASALALKNLTNFILTFSEAVLPGTVTNLANFEIYQSGSPSNRMGIISAQMTTTSNLVLSSTPRTVGINYSVRINGARDMSSSSNQIGANFTMPLNYQVDLVTIDAQTQWRYFQGGALPSTNWAEPNYDDSNWPSGAAMFQAGSPLPVAAVPVRTGLLLTTNSATISTYYFRNAFQLPGPLITNTLGLRHVVDDGAVFYLNGAEIFSIGVSPTRPLPYSSAATRFISAANYEPPMGSNARPVAGALAGSNGTNTFCAEIHQFQFSNPDVAFAASLEGVIANYYPQVRWTAPSNFVEGSGVISNQVLLSVSEPPESELIIQLTSSQPGLLGVPSQVTVLAGSTNVVVPISVGDDSLFNGPREVTLKAVTADGVSASVLLPFLDNETNVLSILAPSSVSETNGVFQGEVRAASPVAGDISVSLSSSDLTELTVPATVVIPNGATSVVFQVSIVNDALLDGLQNVTVTASVPGWTDGHVMVAVSDDESPMIVLTTPASVVEGAGVLTNGGRVHVGGLAVSNLTINLASSSPGLAVVPTNVTISAGQSNVFFNLSLVDNLISESSRTVNIIATSPGSAAVTNVIIVWDDDVHHFRFSFVNSPQYTNTAFSITVWAENMVGVAVTNFKQSITVSATALDGSRPVEPSTVGPFSNGKWSGSMRITAPVKQVTLSCPLAPGESYPFNVEPQAARMLAQDVNDVAFDPVSRAVLATVSAAGPYQDQIVMIDPVTATITNSFPVGPVPGQIEVSPNGQFLYVGLSNNYFMRKVSLATHVLGPIVAFTQAGDSPTYATDFAVLNGMADSVVVTLRNSSIWGFMRRYDSGTPVAISPGSSLYPEQLAAAPTGTAFYAWDDAWPTRFIARLEASPPSLQQMTNAVFSSIGRGFVCVDGVLYGESAQAVSASSLDLLGQYASGGACCVDTNVSRVWFVDYPHYTNVKVKAFDRNSFGFITAVSLPAVTGVPQRLVRWGTNGLAFSTEYSQAWFIQSDVLVPVGLPANIELKLLPPADPVVMGSNATYTLVVSNAGPGMATMLRLSNSLPSGVTGLTTIPSTGLVTNNSQSLTWFLPQLAAGTAASLQFTLAHTVPGWNNYNAFVVADEADLVWTNNAASAATYVQFRADYSGPIGINLGASDVCYDPSLDRLHLSLGNTGNAQSNGIAVFDPRTGLVDAFVPLGTRPDKLARSGNGQYLYVSLPDAALVRQLELPGLTLIRDFPLGSELINGVTYPDFAGDMVVVPGSPDSLVVWRVRRAGPMASEFGRGIAVFDNGVMRSNVTASGGSWKIEFDTDTGTLYGINGSTVQRFTLNSGGLGVADSYPSLAFNSGADFEYGAGLFWTTRGRVLEMDPFAVGGVLSGSENASQVEVDVPAQRVHLLAFTNTIGTLRAYGMDNLSFQNSIVITNLMGPVGPLVRWGTNGLAFTASNQLVLVRGPLVAPTPGANLGIGMTAPTTAAATSNLTYVLTITNQGPERAASVVMTNTILGGATIIAATNSTGSIATNSTRLIWTVGNLEPGSNLVLTVVARAPASGTVTAAAQVKSDADDVSPGDNFSMKWTEVAGAGSSAPQIISLACNDLLWDQAGQRILATVSNSVPGWGNSLVSISPAGRSVNCQKFVGDGAGKMAGADDGSSLFVGVDYAVQQFTLPNLQPVSRFALDPLGGLYSLRDLEVKPGAPSNVVALTSSFIGLYQGGVRHSNTLQLTGQAISFGDSPDQLHLLRSGVFYGGHMELSRIGVNSSGISLQQTLPGLGPWGVDGDLKTQSGRLYTSPGFVLNPDSLNMLGAFPYIPSGSLMLPVAELGRVLFLFPEGTNWTIAAFAAETRQRIGAVAVPGLLGKPSSLIRWGEDGLAFRTSSNQVFMLQTSLLPTNPPADVSLAVQTSEPRVTTNNLVQSLTLSNAGPHAATNVVWTCSLPTSSILVGINSQSGVLQTNGTTLLGQLAHLAAGAAQTITLTFACPAPGIYPTGATVQSDSSDPDPSNNITSDVLWIQPPSMQGYGFFNLPVKDLVRDPNRSRLYASLGTNAGSASSRIIAIDPAQGVIRETRFVGHDPGRMAASSDGKFLYVALDAEGVVQRVHLPSLVPDLRFPVTNAFPVVDLGVAPTNSNLALVRPKYGGGIQLYENGLRLGNELTGLDVLAFSDLDGELFGCDGYHSGVPLWRISINSNGLEKADSQPAKPSGTTEMKFDAGTLYYNGGMVLDPVTRRVKGVLPVPGISLVEPDSSTARIYALTPSPTWTLRAFDKQQFIESGSAPVVGLAGTPKRLWRWGTNGVAFITPTQLFLAQSALIPENTLADLHLTGSVAATSVTNGSLLNYSLVISNTGPAVANGVTVTQQFSLPVTGLIASASQGTTTLSTNSLIWNVGTLGVDAGVNLTLQARPLSEGTLVFRASAWHAANDPKLANNTLLLATLIGPPSPTNTIVLNLATRDLVYDSLRNRVYASIPASVPYWGNSVAVINPATAEVERSIFVGSEPNQLAISHDGHFLYASLNGTMGVVQHDLQGNLPNWEFELGVDDMYNAFDLQVAPGQPERIAVSRVSLNTSGDYPSDVSIYDSGIRQALAGRATKTLAFSSDANWLFGYVTPGTGYGFLRMPLTSTGIITNEVFTTFGEDFVEVRHNNGRLYTYTGKVLDPYLPLEIGSMGSSGTFAVDEIAGRSCYLSQSGTNWNLRAHQLTDLQLVATQLVAGVQGSPASLIRCGGNKLAFRTSSNQVFIVATPLVPTNSVPAADLSVVQTAFQNPANPTETLHFEITVSNSGPSSASNVQLSIRPPASISSQSLELPQGTSTNLNENYICSLGTLPAGQSLHLTLKTEITNTSTYTCLVSVGSASPDPQLADNYSSIGVQGMFYQRSDSVRITALGARDLAYDQIARRLYATVADTNSTGRVAVINPETGYIEGDIPVATAPKRLALSDNGQYLYVSFVGTNRIQRIHLASKAVDFEFSPPTSHPLTEMVCLPNQPHALAISCLEYTGNYVAVLDDGIARNATLSNKFKLLAVSEGGMDLYGIDNSSGGGASPDMFRMSITTNGLQLVNFGPSDRPGDVTDMDFVGGRLYFGNGRVFNPNGWIEEPAFPSGAAEVEVNPAANRAAFLRGSYYTPPATLMFYDLTTRQYLTTIAGSSSWGGTTLTQCGADRFAYLSESELVFIRSSAIPTADIQLSGQMSTNAGYAGELFNITLVVSNRGISSASGLMLTNQLPDQCELAGMTISQGTSTANGHNLIVSLGALNTNAVATIILQLRPTNSSIRLFTNGSIIAASSIPDPFPANNIWTGTFASTPDADRDGLPDDWELARGLSPTNAADAPIDSDCDGSSNLQEYATDTNPLQFEPLLLQQPRINSQGAFEFTLNAAIGKSYALQVSTNLITWTTLRTVVCRGSNERVVLMPAQVGSRSFFRLQTDLTPARPLLRLLNAPSMATNHPVLEILAPPGRTYELQRSTNMTGWMTVTNFTGTDCSLIVEDQPAPAPGWFYRLIGY